MPGREDRSAVITWTASTLPGCIGGAPGTCNGSANAVNAVDVEAGASNTVKLKNIIVNGGSSTNPALHVGTAFNMSMTQVTLRGGSGTIPEIMPGRFVAGIAAAIIYEEMRRWVLQYRWRYFDRAFGKHAGERHDLP